jgi:Putative zinc-finger
MDCHDYIENFLAADVDGELSVEERRAADEHLAGCPRCRTRLAQERELKRMLRERLRSATAPSELRAAISSALDREEVSAGPRSRFSEVLAALLRPQVWAPLAALAAAIVIAIAIRGRSSSEIPQFDPVLEQFSRFEKNFEPNVPSNSLADVAEHYHNAHMPSFIWNFNPFGFKLAGGRIDKLADGRLVTYTLYRGPGGAIMCSRFKTDDLSVPRGGHEIRTNQYVYSYKGYSVIYTLDTQRHFVCLLISRMPAQEFAHDIEHLES